MFLLSGWSSAILFLTRRRAREVAPYATAVLLGIAAFFVGLIVFLETPFGQLSPAPIEGAGLNPLLRHPAMMFHPPMLYSGYTLFTIPFAFAIGALITRRLGHRLAPHGAAVRAGRLAVPGLRLIVRRALVVLRAGLGRATGAGTASRTPRSCRG